MLSLITADNFTAWDDTVKRFQMHDVYYLVSYVEAFRIHGDGTPVLLYYENLSGLSGACVLFIRDISFDPRFKDMIEPEKFFDAATPYGYGGFIFNREPSQSEVKSLKKELIESLSRKGIVSVFFRFHPVLRNSSWSREIAQVVDVGKTVCMELENPEQIWNDLTSKNRNMIRKAEKAGVVIKHGVGMELLREFRAIYNATMESDHAAPYYFFEKDFYEAIERSLHSNYEIFYAEYDGRIISMAIMIFAGEFLNYHLSGSVREFRNLAPSNLLLYKAALWGCKKGFNTFHLGGGLGAAEDNLYKFKAGFNRRSDYTFSIGKMILDSSKYEFLVKLREGLSDFEPDSEYFPLYRQ